MKAAVLGSPIEHSLSPVLHLAGYAAAGLADWSYERHRLEAAELAGFVAGLDEQWRGLSLTMPLKQECLVVASEVTALARRAGAGNTLTRLPGGAWRADNTDVGGLMDALRPAWQPEWQDAAVLGAGATARSALLALEGLGVTQVTVHARRSEQVAGLSAWAEAADLGLVVKAAALAEWGSGRQPVVLSTLPPGTGAENSLSGARAGLLFDAVYAGWPTPLAQRGAAAGMQVIGGLELLVAQAARQFEQFTGVAAPLEAMRAAGRAALGA